MRKSILPGLILGGFLLGASTAEAGPLPPSAAGAPAAQDTIVLSGGCFWGVQAVYQHVEGVLGAASGYVGGTAETATYRQVAGGGTDHAESVRVIYDPSRVSLPKLLQIFFDVVHDPTQLNRQGPDVGPQYRSAIWYGNAEQKRVAERYIAQLEKAGAFDEPIVTEVKAAEPFYLAEAYHQDYLHQNPRQPYIVYHDMPKLEALEKRYPELWREDPIPWNGAMRTTADAGR